jgi:hypothetical protein
LYVMKCKIFKLIQITENIAWGHEGLRLRWKLTSGQEGSSVVTAMSRVTLESVYQFVRHV